VNETGAGDGSISVEGTCVAGEVKKGFAAFLEGDVLFAMITPCMENGKMADPACGTGGFLLAAHDYVVKHNAAGHLGSRLCRREGSRQRFH
jgi:hypothetical protein